MLPALIANRYELGTLLEQGGMGEVYHGRDTLSGEQVAIKVLRADLVAVDEAVMRFEREGALLRSLDHPNIVKLLDIAVADGRRCLIMEYIGGGSLETALAAQPRMPIQPAIRLTIDLADALARVHQAGLLHRDIKPSNVLLDSAGNGHLSDFGIAALDQSSNLTPSGAVLGTYAYLSPEACAGETLDHRSDLWSLGVLLYEALAGRRPFEGNNPAAIIGAIMYRPLPDLRAIRPDITPGLATLVERLLLKQRDERLGSARLVAATAEALLRGDPRPLPPLSAEEAAAQASATAADREHLDNLLQIHRRNLMVLERRAALYGIAIPLELQNQLDFERGELAQVEVLLGKPSETTHPNVPAAPRTNLPTPPTALIGREHDAHRAQKLLRQPDTRLLTLSGPGGTGKTRLAIEIASGMTHEFRNGVWFVDLTALRNPALVGSSIAQVLDYKEESGSTIVSILKAALRDKQLLIVLDNFEQVIEAAPLVAEVLAFCPDIKLLVTSRALLRIAAEREFAVAPLPTPDLRRLPPLAELTRSPAVALFVKAAQLTRPGFTVTSENGQAIAAICARLDGLPLALELAAAQCRILGPQQLLKRLERRLESLKGGARDLAARQQTLRGAIDWSYDLLPLGEQTLFARLAVFAGGCTFEQIDAVCANPALSPLGLDSLDGVSALVEKSLLRQSEDAQGEPCFGMLETIREYAGERLLAIGEDRATRRAHASHFAALAAEAEPHLIGSEQQEWLARLEREHDNLRGALDWLLKHAPEQALAVAAALWRFWYTRGHLSEGREWLEKALASATNAPPADTAKALNGVGGIAWAQGDYPTASTYQQQALALYEQLDDKRGMARALNVLGVIARGQNNLDIAEHYYVRSLTLAQALDDHWATANSLSNLGLAYKSRNELQQAKTFYEQSLDVRRQLNDPRGIAISLVNTAEILILQSDYERAWPYLQESLLIRQELRDLEGIVVALEQHAIIFFARNERSKAVVVWGAANALRRRINAQMPHHEQMDYEARLAVAKSLLGEADFDAAWEQGTQLTTEQAVALALEPT